MSSPSTQPGTVPFHYEHHRPEITLFYQLVAQYYPQFQKLRQQFGLGENVLVVLQVGSGFRTKGVERALTALAALPAKLRDKVRYFLIGS